jgi:hypothetical protein
MGFLALCRIHMEVVVRQKCICSMADACMTSSSNSPLKNSSSYFYTKKSVHADVCVDAWLIKTDRIHFVIGAKVHLYIVWSSLSLCLCSGEAKIVIF